MRITFPIINKGGVYDLATVHNFEKLQFLLKTEIEGA